MNSPINTFSAGSCNKTICIQPAINAPTAYTSVLLNDTPATFGYGNIGRLAINIAANRLLATGATPRYVGATVVIDTDTPREIISAVADAMRGAAVQAEMDWASTEVRYTDAGVRYGFSLSVFGVGEMSPRSSFSAECIRPSDSIILTGPVGAWGAAVKATENDLMPLMIDDGESLCDAIHALLRVVPGVHCMVFPEYGFNKALSELKSIAGLSVDRSKVAVDPAVSTVCDLLALDPLELPTAGAMIIIVDAKDEAATLEVLHRSPHTGLAATIGHIDSL